MDQQGGAARLRGLQPERPVVGRAGREPLRHAVGIETALHESLVAGPRRRLGSKLGEEPLLEFQIAVEVKVGVTQR